MDTAKLLPFLEREYGMRGRIKALDGEADANFLWEEDSGAKRLIKIAGLSTSRPLLAAQIEALDFLNGDGELAAFLPRVIRNGKSQSLTPYIDEENAVRQVRVLSYLDGDLLVNADHTPELLSDLGRKLASIDKKLFGYSNPVLEARDYRWDLKRFPDIEPLLDYIQPPRDRALAKYFLLQYRQFIQPRLADLRMSVIHGDANDYNVLVRDGKVAGLIDFGDMVHSHTINELAVALAYAMMHKTDPLTAAAPLIRGYHAVLPLLPEEASVLYHLIAARLCTTVAMAAWGRIRDPGKAYLTISEKAAWELLGRWIEINPVRAEDAFSAACGLAPPAEPATDRLRESRKKRFSPALSLAYPEPIHMVRGAFQYLYDARGRTYVDCVNNVCHVGHCHPDVVQAGQRQMAMLNTNTRYLYAALSEYADMLTAAFPDPLKVVFFLNSGSEATELAMRLARAHTGRKDTMVVSGAYHGNTSACIELSPYKFEGRGGFPMPDHIHKTPLPDTYRGPYRAGDPLAGAKYARALAPLIEALEKRDRGLAAFICESVPGCAGQIILPEGYLREVYRIVRENGGLCIADEVQAGFGRVGSHFWAFETQGVVPDIVTLGKPIGNGHPLAAVVTTEAIARSFANGMEYFNTYGGNPVSCEIGKAVLEVIRGEGLQSNAMEVGSYLLKALRSMQEKHAGIGDVRGMGLMLGVEMVRDRSTLEPAAEEAEALVNLMKERGFLLSTDGPLHNVLKLKPPLCFSMANAERMVEQLDESIPVAMGR